MSAAVDSLAFGVYVVSVLLGIGSVLVARSADVPLDRRASALGLALSCAFTASTSAYWLWGAS